MNRPNCWPVAFIVTHERPHLDELASIWALRRFGTERYPGVDAATIEFFDPEKHLDGQSEKEWLGDGYLFIGVGGGRFDDHPAERFPRDCAFTLVLKDLEKCEDPGLSLIIRDILTEDRQGAPCSLHLASIVKARNRIVGFKDTLSDVELSLEALYEKQLSFHKAVEIVRRSSPISVVNRPSGRPLRLVVAESDNEDISAAGRWREGVHAALVVHRRPKPDGGWTIYLSANDHLGIRDVGWLAKELRLAEYRATGGRKFLDPKRLQADGALPEVPEWYHFKAGAQIYNGSLTKPHAPETRLSLREIQEICVRFLRTYPLPARKADDRT